MRDAAKKGVLPQAGWNVLIDSGDLVEIYGLPYYFDRVDPDHLVTFRPPLGSETGDFMIHGADGWPRKPNVDEVGILWREGNLKFREKPLSSEIRQYARAQELDAAQARAMDKGAEFRMALCRRFDASHGVSRMWRSRHL